MVRRQIQEATQTIIIKNTHQRKKNTKTPVRLFKQMNRKVNNSNDLQKVTQQRPSLYSMRYIYKERRLAPLTHTFLFSLQSNRRQASSSYRDVGEQGRDVVHKLCALPQPDSSVQIRYDSVHVNSCAFISTKKSSFCFAFFFVFFSAHQLMTELGQCASCQQKEKKRFRMRSTKTTERETLSTKCFQKTASVPHTHTHMNVTSVRCIQQTGINEKKRDAPFKGTMDEVVQSRALWLLQGRRKVISFRY